VARICAEATARIIQTRVLLEIQAAEGHEAEARCHIVMVILELLCVTGASEPMHWARSLLYKWYGELPEWKLSIEKTLGRLVSQTNWGSE
jgi:hypothetical protein